MRRRMRVFFNCQNAIKPLAQALLKSTPPIRGSALQFTKRVAVLSLFFSPIVLAQVPSSPRVVLGAARGTSPEEFTVVTSIRELGDGRLLVSDRRDNRVVAVDFESNTVTPVGRSGQGPGEYRVASLFTPLGLDSSILADPNNGRWLILDGTRPVAAVPPWDTLIALARFPAGADDHGHVLGLKYPRHQPGAPFVRDSLTLLLVSRRTRSASVVGRIAEPTVWVGATTGGGDRPEIRNLSIPPWSAGEQAILYPDGWIAIARLEPYRVDWRQPDGQIRLGRSLPYDPAPVTEVEKRAFLARVSRLTGNPPAAPESRNDWPAEFPPFSAMPKVLNGPPAALFTSPSGDVVIARMQTAARPNPSYDVVDRDGQLIGQFTLEWNEQLAGIGKRAAYVVVTDDDGVKRIRRHQWLR